MSVDLTLYVPYQPQQPLGDDVLPGACIRLSWLCGNARRLSACFNEEFRKICGIQPACITQPCHPQPLPPNCKLSLDEKDVTEDDYGAPLTFVTAGEIASLRFAQDDTPPNFTAVQAFMRELPENTPVILYWH